MIDIINKKCKCGKQMSFGYPDDKRPTACSTCKLDGMIDIKNKKCKCGKNMYFGYPDKRPTACSGCKLEGMIDLKHKKCKCGKNMIFGYPDDKRPTACSTCKLDGMIDIITKKCKCGKRMYFGYPDDKRPTACNTCKLDGMINIRDKKCKCGKRMLFGNPDAKRPTACSTCKLDGMIDIISKKCISCGLFNVNKKPYMCSYCIPSSKKKQFTKEMVVVNFLRDCNEIPNFIHNKSIGRVCGNFRPDILIDCNSYFIVVEIDEDQHKSYPHSCEIARMFNIEQSLGLRTHFIRYNPDRHTHNGCLKRVLTTERLKTLRDRIKTLINTKPIFTNRSISIETMYYDY